MKRILSVFLSVCLLALPLAAAPLAVLTTTCNFAGAINHQTCGGPWSSGSIYLTGGSTAQHAWADNGNGVAYAHGWVHCSMAEIEIRTGAGDLGSNIGAEVSILSYGQNGGWGGYIEILHVWEVTDDQGNVIDNGISEPGYDAYCEVGGYFGGSA